MKPLRRDCSCVNKSYRVRLPVSDPKHWGKSETVDASMSLCFCSGEPDAKPAVELEIVAGRGGAARRYTYTVFLSGTRLRGAEKLRTLLSEKDEFYNVHAIGINARAYVREAENTEASVQPQLLVIERIDVPARMERRVEELLLREAAAGRVRVVDGRLVASRDVVEELQRLGATVHTAVAAEFARA